MSAQLFPSSSCHVKSPQEICVIIHCVYYYKHLLVLLYEIINDACHSSFEKIIELTMRPRANEF